jgi:hypothetical protein
VDVIVACLALADRDLGLLASAPWASPARMLDAAVSLLLVLWLGRFAGQVRARREAALREKVVPFRSRSIPPV